MDLDRNGRGGTEIKSADVRILDEQVMAILWCVAAQTTGFALNSQVCLEN